MTKGIINEIIAHASAATFFDPQVDTIFEIGGQDAKYTHITHTIPSDYAMNEACSAGTGSFLEESAFETLGVKMEDIGDIALNSNNPLNFNDQCAAFIASDIKNAIHEGIQKEDILAGLVYSICMNYSNRVKGNRPVGEKVFMQGGVCYNRAVPLAMATLLNKPIVVPPEPGLMGAFGVALVIKKRIEEGLYKPSHFDLEILAKRRVKYGKAFICQGGKEKCDRRCQIEVIELDGKKYPFGGACNKFFNLRNQEYHDLEKLDLIRIRQQLVFNQYGAKSPKKYQGGIRGKVGINKSFLINSYYPFYSTFFCELGFEPIIADTPDKRGIDQKNAAMCYPAELSHGFFYSLLQVSPFPDFLFLPHFKSIPSQNQNSSSQVCPFVQGEKYYLHTAFQKSLNTLRKNGIKILSPLLDLANGLETAKNPMVEMAGQMGVKRKIAEKSFEKAISQQKKCFSEMKVIGAKVMNELERDPAKIAVVIFARSYNGFTSEAHMGIPAKFASRGILVIPYDFLQFEDQKTKPNMYWGIGQQILKACRTVKKNTQLFGVYITNFSCGPDSFIIGYFRNIMGQKPSLTLELDSHTADAGLETRIEAFLDIVFNYRHLADKKKMMIQKQSYSPASIVLSNSLPIIKTSSGKELPLTDPRVTLLFPSMGEISTQFIAAAFRRMGINAKASHPADETELKLGRGNVSGKECLPLVLTTGILLNYIQKEKRKNEVLAYFMATGSGPCRFGQYSVFLQDLIKRMQLPDVALLSLTSENSYMNLGYNLQRQGWRALVTADVMEDIRSMLLANARDTDEAMAIFQKELKQILLTLEKENFSKLKKQLKIFSKKISQIHLKQHPEEVPTILLTGEIFVRRDSISRQYLIEHLAKKGFATLCSPISEWLYYSNYLVFKGLAIPKPTKMEKKRVRLKQWYMSCSEKNIKKILKRSKLTPADPVDIKTLIKNATPHLSPDLTGEAILTVGSSLYEVGINTCGVIAIGPFGCMPNRLSEAILTRIMNQEQKLAIHNKNPALREILKEINELPFLAIESDGLPFPQLIQAKLEAFCLQANRLHKKMIQNRN
jgi:predicted CoA-substrate-specific enzyme activase